MIDRVDCPCFPGDFCVAGYRYCYIGDGPVAKPLDIDLPGTIFVGKCQACVKATGGVEKEKAQDSTTAARLR